MRRKLIVVLCVVFCADLVLGANNVILNCPCQLRNSCFKPLELSSVNETSCVDENFVRCCSETDSHITQIVVIATSTSVEPKPQSDNISVVYPSEMSGIPQTTPVNMPDDYMIHMIDRETGTQMLLVFPKQEETTSEVPTTTTSSTTPSPTTTELTSTSETLESLPASTTSGGPNLLSTTEKPKPNRISVKRRKINRNNNNRADRKQMSPKTNAKIYDVSRRQNFLRRHPNTPQENYQPETSSTTQPTIVNRPFNDELRIKIDQEHKIMIESLKALLIANDHSPVRSSHFDIGKIARVKPFEEIVKVEMVNAIDDIKAKKKPYRGKIKYQDYKWAAIPDSYQEQRISSRTTTTVKPTTTRPTIARRPIITPRPKFNIPSLPHNEFEHGSTLLADFKPSPLWSLKAENIDIVEFNTRVPRTYQAAQFDQLGAESGFVPIVNNGEALQIIGPVPQGFKQRIDDSRLSYELPSQAITNF